MRKLNEPSPNVIVASFQPRAIPYLMQQLFGVVLVLLFRVGIFYGFFVFMIGTWMGLSGVEGRAAVVFQLLRLPIYFAGIWALITMGHAVYEVGWERRKVRLDGNANAVFVGRQQVCFLDEVKKIQVRRVQDLREDGADRYVFSIKLPDGQKLVLGSVSSDDAFEKWRKRLLSVADQPVIVKGVEKEIV